MAAERYVTCSQHPSNAGERNPHIGCDPQFGVGYQQEMLSVPKDAVYAAMEALRLAIGYMPQIKTDVPQWQATLDQDVVKMQCAVAELRKIVR